MNNKQQTKKNMQQRGQGALSTPEKGGEARSCCPCELSVNKACRQALPSEKGGGGKELLSSQTLSKQRLQK
jgi:hypothetical protein